MRLSVESSTVPPGLARSAQARMAEAGSGTCSSISMQTTTSKWPGCRAARSSTAIFSYLAGAPLSRACSRATCSDLSARSTPSVVAEPALASASVRMPPPQPTSTTLRPDRLPPACWTIHSRRSGLMSCRGLNSLSGSHHREASAWNLSSSAWSTLAAVLLSTGTGEEADGLVDMADGSVRQGRPCGKGPGRRPCGHGTG